MGVYKLMEGKEMNGRGVWKCKGWVLSGFMYFHTPLPFISLPSTRFMYYTRNKQWIISREEDMEAGKARGWMYVASTALHPTRSPRRGR
jgi:hypothetical protein